jgi:ABC-type dipeptide/oligopeptide/nickel transport system permease subunit
MSQAADALTSRDLYDRGLEYAKVPFRLYWRFAKTSILGGIAVTMILGLIFIALFPWVLAPYDPFETFPEIVSAPSSEYWLGNDYLGRDVLSRIIWGTRVSLLVAFMSVAVGDGLGFSWGVATGYFGGWFDLLSQRVGDALMGLPLIILALLLLLATGGGLWPVVIAIIIARVPNTARTIRSVSLSVTEMTYVDGARAVGVGDVRIMVKHVAPQCLAALMVVSTVGLGAAIFAEAALSFLNMGVKAPTPTWGNMLGGILSERFKPPWWLVMSPGIAITLAVLAFNLFGDALRDYLDPKLRGRLESTV